MRSTAILDLLYLFGRETRARTSMREIFFGQRNLFERIGDLLKGRKTRPKPREEEYRSLAAWFEHESNYHKLADFVIEKYNQIAKQQQDDRALLGIKLFFGSVPALALVLSLPLLVWYPIIRRSPGDAQERGDRRKCTGIGAYHAVVLPGDGSFPCVPAAVARAIAGGLAYRC